MPEQVETSYVAVLLSVEDINKLEEIAEQQDATIASLIRGIISNALSTPESIASIRPIRRIQPRRKRLGGKQ